MTLLFTKMHGLGNDFIVIDGINQPVALHRTQIKAMARRDTGIGFDQCLVVEKSQDDSDFFYRIFNADGHEVGQCGNGARCLMRFVHHYQLTDKRHIKVSTHTTQMTLRLNEDHTVTVDFDKPNLLPENIPFKAQEQQAVYHLPLGRGLEHLVHAVSVGNPHAVSVVTDITTAPVSHLGKLISKHPLFPNQTNAGFMQIISKNHLHLRVYERGCGETAACGSGAVAAAAVGILYHQMNSRIMVTLQGGQLLVEWPDTNGPISLTGPASFVYEGKTL